jgi:hypothetical protein
MPNAHHAKPWGARERSFGAHNLKLHRMPWPSAVLVTIVLSGAIWAGIWLTIEIFTS